MATSTRPAPQRPRVVPRPTKEQLRWIEARDAIGATIDRYLKPSSPELRAALEAVEDALRLGDHEVGLV